jgi:hypothetical protein
MLTQALPYTSQQQQQRPPLTDSNSNSTPRPSRRFSLRSINSTTSATSIATSSFTHSEELAATPVPAPATENKSKNFQTFIRSLRQRRRRSEGPKGTTTATAGVEEDEIEMLSAAERPRETRKSATAAEVKAKRSSVDSMFSWAAMTIYTYPGAAPVAGWF